MKHVSISTFICLSLASILGLADTAMVPSQTVTTIKGQIVAEAKLSGFAYMVPKYSVVAGPHDAKAEAACKFDEDMGSPNGNQKVQPIELKRDSDTAYTLKVAVGAMRGSCEYVLDSIYLSIEDKKLDEMFKIRTDASVNHSNFLLGADGPEDTLKLEPKGVINCEFYKAKEDLALCFHNNEMMIDDLQIKGTGETFTLDFKDKSPNIFDTIAISN